MMNLVLILIPHVVTFFRHPTQRLLSALVHFVGCYQQAGCACCSYRGSSGWGWSALTRHEAIHAVRLSNGSLAAVADVLRARHGLVSCQAKMLLGMGCHAPTDRLTRAQIASAAALVRDRLAFVGLSERYRESVCLWHATYGGAVWSFEVQGSRDPGPEHDASVLGANFTDEADDIVYAAAQERFGNEVRRTGTSVRISDCLRNVAHLK